MHLLYPQTHVIDINAVSAQVWLYNVSCGANYESHSTDVNLSDRKEKNPLGNISEQLESIYVGI